MAYPLIPVYEYVSNTSALIPRSISGSTIDVGAYEFTGFASIDPNFITAEPVVYPNPSTGLVYIGFRQQASKVEVYNSLGAMVFSTLSTNSAETYQLDLSSSPEGVYLLKISDGETVIGKTIVIR